MPSTPIPMTDKARSRIGIGVTGHRAARLQGIDTAAMQAAVRDVMRQIAATANLPDPRDIRMITNLADGADSLVADVALELGWRLDVALPFPRSDYATDFTQADRARYEAQLAAAAAVFELPGTREEDRGGAAAAYERAGRVVLAQCDVLIGIWDGRPAQGRGGAAQIIAEAVLQGVPVIHIHTDPARPPMLLWDGLAEHDLGQQTVETVSRSDLSRLSDIMKIMLDAPDAPADVAALHQFEAGGIQGSSSFAFAYPLMLTLLGAGRRKRKGPAATAPATPPPEPTGALGARFHLADAQATRAARLFRSGYVINFAFAALAVVLAMAGLVLPALKPALVAWEVLIIVVILVLTRAGNRLGWHRQWLDHRHLAERLRCLAITAQLGDLDLRATIARRPGWASWYARATARELGMPSVVVDQPYLERQHAALLALIDDQVGYLAAETKRMHLVEHRLHRLGTWLFATTAAVCTVLLLFKLGSVVADSYTMKKLSYPLSTAVTIASAVLPAIGASIYGIRMHGDFGGTAERNENLAHQLLGLRHVTVADEISFDTLHRRARRLTDLLTQDLSDWLQVYHARPLSLPG